MAAPAAKAPAPAGRAKANAPAAPAGPSLVCLEAQKVLKLSKGRRRVPVEDLGPALFNRFGSPLSGKQVLDLANRILKIEGFCSFRYVAGWCHEVYRHATTIGRTDPVLPRYPEKPLLGCFRKNHLVAFLQLLKIGKTALPGGNEIMAAPAGSDWEELHMVLKHGIEMEVFSHADVMSHKAAFEGLMAADNFDAAFALAEDEFGVMCRLRTCMSSVKVPPGGTLWDEVVLRVMPLTGNKWGNNELARLWNFCNTISPEALAFLQSFARFMVDAKNFRVPSQFFQVLADLPAKYQGLRMALTVAQLCSEPKDCQAGQLTVVPFSPSIAPCDPCEPHITRDKVFMRAAPESSDLKQCFVMDKPPASDGIQGPPGYEPTTSAAGLTVPGTVNLFWWLLAIERTPQTVKLIPRVQTFTVPLCTQMPAQKPGAPPGETPDGCRKAAKLSKLELELPCFWNSQAIEEGIPLAAEIPAVDASD